MAESVRDVKQGAKILLNKAPCVVLEKTIFSPGKGRSTVTLKCRNLLTGDKSEKVFSTNDTVELADVREVEAQCLYFDGSEWIFMNQESFEQYQCHKKHLEDALNWLKEQDICKITLWNDNPIHVAPPTFVVLKIVETEPERDKAGSGGKPAKLETGAVVKVPSFVQEGEFIKVDTRDGTYLERAKG